MSKGIKMKQLLELLRLHYELKFSQRDVVKMVNISKTTVHNYIELFETSGLSWPLAEEYLDETKLMAKLNKQSKFSNNDNDDGGSNSATMNFTEIHHELKSTIITSQLSTDGWHSYLNNPTLADAILDRLLSQADKIELTGDSLRWTEKRKGGKKMV